MSAPRPFQSRLREEGSQAIPASLDERLDYLADLILELKAIAETAQLNTLAVILAAAWEEARQQRDAARKR